MANPDLSGALDNNVETVNGLFSLLFKNFHISDIYVVGWDAAQQWMALVTGILVVIAIGIRSVEEQVNLLSGGQSGYQRMVTNVVLIGVAIGLYFTIVNLVLEFFDAIYYELNNTPVAKMTQNMDKAIADLWAKDYQFRMSEIIDGFLALFGLMAFWITYMILVCVGLCMHIAHALLTTATVFWGGVALPMSITLGLKQLSSFKVMATLALVWPIIEFFFMYLIGGAFNEMFTRSDFNIESLDHVSMARLVTYFTVFSVINLVLAATTVSAPFFAYGIASGSGNVTGMIKAFAAAGVGAGLIVARATMPRSLTEKGGANRMVRSALGGTASALGAAATGAAGGVIRAMNSPSGAGARANPGGWFDSPKPTQSGPRPKPTAEQTGTFNRSYANSPGVTAAGGSDKPNMTSPYTGAVNKPSSFSSAQPDSQSQEPLAPRPNASLKENPATSKSFAQSVGVGSKPVDKPQLTSRYTGGSNQPISGANGPVPNLSSNPASNANFISSAGVAAAKPMDLASKPDAKPTPKANKSATPKPLTEEQKAEKRRSNQLRGVMKNHYTQTQKDKPKPKPKPKGGK